MNLREQIIQAIDGTPWPCPHSSGDPDSSETCRGCTVDAILAVVEPALWRARNVAYGRCRTCGAAIDDGKPHRMHCRHYTGHLEHHWIRTGWNGTFGGTDYDCVCGGWFRRGGLAGHGDGSEHAEPVCPHADQTKRVAT